jgi:hypothetical protein
MVERVLSFIVVMAPFLLTVGIEVIDKRRREGASWRYGVMVFGLALSGLTWLQQARETTASARDRESAIQETSEKVAAETSKTVTKVVTEQYLKIFADQVEQNGRVQKKLDVLTAFVTHPPASLDSNQMAAVARAINGTSELPREVLHELPDEILTSLADNLKKSLHEKFSEFDMNDNGLYARQFGQNQDKMREARKQLRAKVFSDNKEFAYAKLVSDECARRPSLNLNTEAKELTAVIAQIYSVPCCDR